MRWSCRFIPGELRLCSKLLYGSGAAAVKFRTSSAEQADLEARPLPQGSGAARARCGGGPTRLAPGCHGQGPISGIQSGVDVPGRRRNRILALRRNESHNRLLLCRSEGARRAMVKPDRRKKARTDHRNRLADEPRGPVSLLAQYRDAVFHAGARDRARNEAATIRRRDSALYAARVCRQRCSRPDRSSTFSDRVAAAMAAPAKELSRPGIKGQDPALDRLVSESRSVLPQLSLPSTGLANTTGDIHGLPCHIL
jgi:hypothetical protein